MTIVRAADVDSPGGLGAAIAGLNGWARHRSVGAEDAAVAGLRLEPAAAGLAVVEELAGVRRHLLCLAMAAAGAGDSRFKGHHYWIWLPENAVCYRPVLSRVHR